jgi:hypothetical protein
MWPCCHRTKQAHCKPYLLAGRSMYGQLGLQQSTAGYPPIHPHRKYPRVYSPLVP